MQFFEGFVAGFATAGILAVWTVGWRRIAFNAWYRKMKIPHAPRRRRRSQAVPR